MPDWEPPKPKVSLNSHGIIGALLVIAAMAIAAVRQWQIPWLYLVLAILGYLVAVIAVLSENSDTPPEKHSDENEEDYRKRVSKELEEKHVFRMTGQYAAHLSFLFLTLGLLIPFHGFWTGTGIFIASVAAGCAIPVVIFNPMRLSGLGS